MCVLKTETFGLRFKLDSIKILARNLGKIAVKHGDLPFKRKDKADYLVVIEVEDKPVIVQSTG